MRLGVPSTVAALIAAASAPTLANTAATSPVRRTRLTPPPPVVTITAREYAFDGPDSIPSGPTAFRLVSAGREDHFLGLVKLVGSHTLEDYRRELAAKRTPSWAVSVGGVGTIPPGGSAMTILDIEPGLYAMACDMEDAHGTPHMLEGMLRALTVLPRRTGASMRAPDLTIDLTEFAFVGRDTLPPGHRIIDVHNVGSQPHMALVWRLAPGRSARAAIHWMETPSDSSHPVTLAGGTPDLSRGHEAELVLDLKPGRYLLICLVDDPADHRPHYAKGMLKEITVRPAIHRTSANR